MSIERRLNWNSELEDRELLLNTATDLITPVRGLVRSPQLLSIGDISAILAEENQGRIGSCQGHALSTAVEVCYFIASGEYKQFSRAYGYYAAQRQDNLLGRDRGSTISGGVTVAKQRGVPLDPVWPYDGTYNPHPPGGWEAVYEAASQYKIKTHTMIRGYDDAYEFLASALGAISLGIAWTSSCEPTRDGLITKYSGGNGGGHAICLPFLSTRKDVQGRPWVWLANSWGTGWGNGGYAEVSPAAFNSMCNDGNTVAIGISDLTNAEPRQFSFADFWRARYGSKE
jgi:hypothetical protein